MTRFTCWRWLVALVGAVGLATARIEVGGDTLRIIDLLTERAWTQWLTARSTGRGVRPVVSAIATSPADRVRRVCAQDVIWASAA